MSLIDSLLDKGMDAENDPHPQEGVFFADDDESETGTFLRVEDETAMKEQEVPQLDDDENFVMGPNGKPVMVKKVMPVPTGRHKLVKYTGITRQEARDAVFPEGELITLDTWDGCGYFYNKQMDVIRGELSEEDFQKELEEREQTGREPEVVPEEEDKYPEMLLQCMTTISQPRGLDDERLMDYLKYEITSQYNIADPDEDKIQQFIDAFRKADQPELYDPDYVAPSGTGFYAEDLGGRIVVSFPSGEDDASNDAMAEVGGQTIAEGVFSVQGDLQSVSDQLTAMGHAADHEDAKELFGSMKKGGFLDAPVSDE